MPFIFKFFISVFSYIKCGAFTRLSVSGERYMKKIASVFEMFYCLFFHFVMWSFYMSVCLWRKLYVNKKICLYFWNVFGLFFHFLIWFFYSSVCLWWTLYENLSLVCLSVFGEHWMKMNEILPFIIKLISVFFSHIKCEVLLVCLSLENAICKLENSASIIEMFLVCFFTF